MIIDRYTKLVLTIIAAALSILAYRAIVVAGLPQAHAATTHSFVPKDWGRAFAVTGSTVWFEDAHGHIVGATYDYGLPKYFINRKP